MAYYNIEFARQTHAERQAKNKNGNSILGSSLDSAQNGKCEFCNSGIFRGPVFCITIPNKEKTGRIILVNEICFNCNVELIHRDKYQTEEYKFWSL